MKTTGIENDEQLERTVEWINYFKSGLETIGELDPDLKDTPIIVQTTIQDSFKSMIGTLQAQVDHYKEFGPTKEE